MLKTLGIGILAAAAIVLPVRPVSAHCDALDGPVVQAARAALEKGDVALVLRWVPAEREADVRAAFDRTVAVRGLGHDARALADTWFFETLVRIHRAGEGESFDGLKPAGHIEPFIAAVDRSLADGSPDHVVEDVTVRLGGEIRKRFARARDAKPRADASVGAGRDYVAAYVDYLHFVEALYRAGAHAPAGHESAAAVPHGHEPH